MDLTGLIWKLKTVIKRRGINLEGVTGWFGQFWIMKIIIFDFFQNHNLNP